MGTSVLGPTLGDLATNVEQNISNISYIFVGRSGGYMLGSILAGILFDFINHQLLLGKSANSGPHSGGPTPGCSESVKQITLLEITCRVYLPCC